LDKFRDKECNWRKKVERVGEDIPKVGVRYSLQQCVERTVRCNGVIIILIILTYLLTPWSRVLLVKLAGLQLVKKFPTFYGTRRFLTAITSARHLSLS
jgi:hypothetical protein